MLSLWNAINDPSQVGFAGVWIARFLIILLVICAVAYWVVMIRRVRDKDYRALSPVVALRYVPKNSSEIRALIAAPFFIIFLLSTAVIPMGVYGIAGFILCAAGFISSLLFYYRKWEIVSLLFMGLTAIVALVFTIIRLG